MSAWADGGPAFPLGYEHRLDCKHGRDRAGMTLRDYFAAKAMAEVMRAPGGCKTGGEIACIAYEMADAMLAARAPKLDFSMDQKDFEAECSAMLNNGIAQFLIGKELVQFFDEWELVIPPDARERLRVLVEAVKEDAKGGAA